MNLKINHATQKTQRQTHGPTGLCELFLLTVAIEEVARCQYETVEIICPLNLQTVTITLELSNGWEGTTIGQDVHKHSTCNSGNNNLMYIWS